MVARIILRNILAAAVVLWAARVWWLTSGYFLDRATYPRHLVESSAMVLVAAGLLLVVTRGGRDSDNSPASASPVCTPERQPGRLPAPWRLFLVMAALALALWWPAIDTGFLSDDFVLSAWASEGGLVRHAETGFFRPVPLALWAASFASFGVSPPALHVLNVLLHALNATLVCVLASSLGVPSILALWAGLGFLVFPAAAEAVVWCSGIQDVFLTTCTLATLLLCRRSASSVASGVMALVCATVALGVKETAVIVPALCAITWAGTSTWRNARVRRVVAALLVLSAAYVGARAVVGIQTGYWRAPTRYIAKELIVRPFATLVTPWRTSVVDAHPAIGLIGGTLVLAALVVSLLIWTRRDERFHVVLRMALWVLAGVAPVYVYFMVTDELAGSRYVYLSAAGWVVLVASMIAPSPGAPRRPVWRRTVLGIAAMVLIAWGAGVRQEIGFWHRAAQLRDQVLRSAGEAAKAAGCTRIALADAPDSLAGPFVFRNGLAEALALNGLPALAAPSAVSSSCTFRWSNGRFVPDPLP